MMSIYVLRLLVSILIVADEGINSESFKHVPYWLKLESLMSFLPSLVNNNVKMGELYNIDTTQACPSTAPT